MNWLECSFIVRGELVEPVADLLARYAPGGVVIEPWPQSPTAEASSDELVVRAWMPVDEELAQKRRGLEEGLWHLSRIEPMPAPAYREVEEIEWAEQWRKDYRPLQIGRRLVIVPAWLPLPPGDRLPIFIEHGMAFGTGTHPTTQLCMEALETHLRPDQIVVDLGCGSGILSIAACVLGAQAVHAWDHDLQAVQAARANIARNRASDCIQVAHGSLKELLAAQQESHLEVDLLLANILAGTLERMLEGGLAGAVAAGGILVLSGILENQLPALLQRCEEVQLKLIKVLRAMDWCALVLKRTAPV